MLKYLIMFVCAFWLAAAGQAGAVESLRAALAIHQWDLEQQQDVLLYTDTNDFLVEVEATGFATCLSLSVKVIDLDSLGARFQVHVFTLDTQSKNYARSFDVEYGLPARIDDILGKGNSRLSLTVVPIASVDVDTSFCGYLHSSADDFRVDPTAHLDIHYVPQSLADFYWGSIKGLMEDEYRQFDKLVNFSLPGKYDLYACPCKIRSIIWDDRFGMMVDPTRNGLFSIYTKDFNSTYPFLVNQAAIFRKYGYAPAFLSEGFANYLSFAVQDMKEIRREGKTIPLDDLLDTYAFYQADPLVADLTSATFVRYLIEQYDISSFLDLYRQADDLNLRESLQEVYKKTPFELEAEWLHYVDTIPIKFRQTVHYADRAETMLDEESMLRYARELLPLAADRNDSLQALSLQVRSSFFNGEYYGAAEKQEAKLSLDSADASGWMALAAYRMMNGEFDLAAENLERARGLDSSSQVIAFNRGFNHLLRGDKETAAEIFEGIIATPGMSGTQTESRVMLGYILLGSGKEAERSQAVSHFSEVINSLSAQSARHNPSPSQSMWLGICYLGIGDTGSAHDYLTTALFLETRPFFEGMIELWLGKVADVRGEHAVAREHYGRVMALPAAIYHQDEARKLIETPYRQ
jgi:tetratricopeptide (TPR) repeat protein